MMANDQEMKREFGRRLQAGRARLELSAPGKHMVE